MSMSAGEFESSSDEALNSIMDCLQAIEENVDDSEITYAVEFCDIESL